MQISYPVYQWWKAAKDPVNDRLMYEVVGARTLPDAQAILKELLGKLPRGLQVRISFTILDLS